MVVLIAVVFVYVAFYSPCASRHHHHCSICMSEVRGQAVCGCQQKPAASIAYLEERSILPFCLYKLLLTIHEQTCTISTRVCSCETPEVRLCAPVNRSLLPALYILISALSLQPAFFSLWPSSMMMYSHISLARRGLSCFPIMKS